MQLHVPPPFRKPMSELADLPEEHARKLIGAIQTADTFQPVGQLRDAARAALPVDSADQADRLVPSLLSLSGLARTYSAEAIADSVARSIDLDLSTEARDRLHKRLEALLSAEALSTTADAVELLTQHPHNYQTARIISDIRPVFSGEVDEQPTGAVIVDVLQLQVWDRDGQTDTLYVAMDEPDLQQLKKVVDRALAKTKTLRAFLGDQGVKHFELDKRET